MYVGKLSAKTYLVLRYLCLRTMLDIAQVDLSQDSRTVKL